MDVDELYEWGEYQVGQDRKTRSPRWGVIHTYRFNAHSKGDDTRDPSEVEKYRSQDPILLQASRMGEQDINLINESIEREIEQALLEIEATELALHASEVLSARSCAEVLWARSCAAGA